MSENEQVEQQEAVSQEQVSAPVFVNILLNVDEVNLIFAALQEMPHKTVDNLLRNILSQAQAQLAKTPDDE